MPPQLASNTSLVQAEQALMAYEAQTNLIGLVTPLFEETTMHNTSKGWYKGSNRILRVTRSSTTRMLTSWEKSWDTDEAWQDLNQLLLPTGGNK
jgi:hypothetical protein